MLDAYTPNFRIFDLFLTYFHMKFMVPMIPLDGNMSVFIAGNKRGDPKPSTVDNRI